VFGTVAFAGVGELGTDLPDATNRPAKGTQDHHPAGSAPQELAGRPQTHHPGVVLATSTREVTRALPHVPRLIHPTEPSYRPEGGARSMRV
jgi:hypothetical protein